MDIDKQKSLALEFCIDIANDYTEDEVKRFAPMSVQMAWKTGNDYLDHKVREDRKRRKGMTL